jgi:glyoxylase-like metal-dependent hydrolase (beta-lactamase superfamily II)
MRLIAPGVWQLAGLPPNLFNVYLMEDVVVDAAARWSARRILRQLRGRTVRLVALTHCHPDHQGSASVLCTDLGVPLACHEADVPAMEGRCAMVPQNWIIRQGIRFLGGPPHPVSRVLKDGDQVAGFRVIHTPGHTPGHVIYFRDADRLAIAGDLLANLHFLSFRPGLREPPFFFSADPARNRQSILTLADLKPALVCFGHGPPLRDPELFQRFAERFRGNFERGTIP